MVYCTSDTLPLVEVRSGTKFTAPFGSAFTKCRRTSNGLKMTYTHTIRPPPHKLLLGAFGTIALCGNLSRQPHLRQRRTGEVTA